MRFMRLAAIGMGVGVAIAGCTVTVEPPPSCDAAAASFLIGTPATAANVETARLAAGASVVRVLEPGEIVTMEFRADRLNVELDGLDFIRDVRCG